MVKFENISFSYSSSNPLINGLSSEIQPGNIYGLLGKNGAGKTSLLKLIAGLRKPQTGKVEVMGYTPSDRKADFSSQYYFVPEEIFTPSVKIRTYLKLYRDYYPNFSIEKFNQYMEDFELNEDMHLGKISFGQRKKFVLSFAIASGTPLVLFDEPTNGLDIPSKSVFRKLAASAISDERCFVISTHQIRDLNLLLDGVMILNHGKLLLNETLFNLSTKYSFVFLKRNQAENNVLYSEEHIDGIKAIIPNEDGEETNVDLELLFNAVALGKIKL